MKPVRFREEALAELLEQARYYEDRSVGLGVRFIDEVQAAANVAGGMPGIGSPYKYRTRRVFRATFLTRSCTGSWMTKSS